MSPLFPTIRKVSGWDAAGEGLTRRFRHPTGWRIEHCGHATARWPWIVTDPQGNDLPSPGGHHWGSLSAAKEAAQAVLDGAAHVVVEGDTRRLIFSPAPQPAEKSAGVGE